MPPALIGIGAAIGVLGAGVGIFGSVKQNEQNQAEIERQREAAAVQSGLLTKEYDQNKLKLENQLASLQGTQGLLTKQKGRAENMMRSAVGASGFAMAGSMQEELDFQNQQFDMKLADVGRAITEGKAGAGLLDAQLAASQELNNINAESLNAQSAASQTNMGIDIFSNVINFGSGLLNMGARSEGY